MCMLLQYFVCERISYRLAFVTLELRCGGWENCLSIEISVVNIRGGGRGVVGSERSQCWLGTEFSLFTQLLPSIHKNWNKI